MEMLTCPHCLTCVQPSRSGFCPSCRKSVLDPPATPPVQAPHAPDPPPEVYSSGQATFGFGRLLCLVGFFLFCVGGMLPVAFGWATASQVQPDLRDAYLDFMFHIAAPAADGLGKLLLLVGPFVWAREKGYSIAISLLLGLLNGIGWILLFFLPNCTESPPPDGKPAAR